MKSELKITCSSHVKKFPGRLILLTGMVAACLAGGVLPVSATPLNKPSLYKNVLKITGKVTDEKGEPLVGVSVTIKGGIGGTTTDAEGKFKLNVTDENSVLVFKYLGYTVKEVAVNNQTVINVSLTPNSKDLSEVVVVGYGTQRASNISGSVSSVSDKKIAQNPAANLSNALVGQAAGVIATQTSGKPGSDASNIFIRGIGTTGDASPIYVIDGIVRSQGDFAQLNSSEIQSFSILKDAASAAVFGVRGGNGVVLVTTKRGASGKMQISYNANFGVQKLTATREPLNSYEYATLYNEALANAGKPALYTEQQLDAYKNHTDPDAYPDADWASILESAPTLTQHNLSANGGTDKIRYATSLSYLDQNGLVPTERFKRYNFRSNIDADVTKSTTLSFDLSGRSEDYKTPGDAFRWLYAIPANRTPIRYSNGNYPGGPSYNILPENGYQKNGRSVFLGRVQLVQKLPFIPGLSIKGVAAYDRAFSDNKNYFFPVVPYFTRLPDGTYRQESSALSTLSQNHDDNASVTLETHLNYERAFGKNKVNGLLLYTQTTNQYNSFNAYREQYTINIDELNFGAAANRNNGGGSSNSGRQGIVGRLNYSFNDKITIETSFRADGSEQFAKGNRWGFFPSVSGAYNISREDFLNNIEAIDNIKLRGSYGILGNDRIGGSRFLYLSSYKFNTIDREKTVFGNDQVQPGIVEGLIGNPLVTWETVKKLDLGFDASFFNAGLTTTFDYFYDKRSNILGQRTASIPAILGISNDNLPVENFGKVDNRGFEVSVGHQKVVNNKLRYTLNGNVTYARSKVIFIDEPASTNPNIKRTGQPLGTVFGLKAMGLFQSQEEVDAAPKQIGTTGPGDIRFADINNDGKINDDDRVRIGSANTPQVIYGLNGTINFHKFELSFLLQGAAKVDQYYEGEGIWPFFVGATAYKSNLDRWTPNNPNASEPRVLVDPNNMNWAYSSFWLKDASYLKLRSLQVAYDFPATLTGKTFVKGLRLYVNCNNVYTWTKIKNFDPENQAGRGWAYPQMRVFNTGLNVRF